MDIKAIVSRLIAAAIGVASAKLAAKTGIVIDPATQASIVVGVYAGLHKVVEPIIKKIGN